MDGVVLMAMCQMKSWVTRKMRSYLRGPLWLLAQLIIRKQVAII